MSAWQRQKLYLTGSRTNVTITRISEFEYLIDSVGGVYQRFDRSDLNSMFTERHFHDSRVNALIEDCSTGRSWALLGGLTIDRASIERQIYRNGKLRSFFGKKKPQVIQTDLEEWLENLNEEFVDCSDSDIPDEVFNEDIDMTGLQQIIKDRYIEYLRQTFPQFENLEAHLEEEVLLNTHLGIRNSFAAGYYMKKYHQQITLHIEEAFASHSPIDVIKSTSADLPPLQKIISRRSELEECLYETVFERFHQSGESHIEEDELFHFYVLKTIRENNVKLEDSTSMLYHDLYALIGNYVLWNNPTDGSKSPTNVGKSVNRKPLNDFIALTSTCKAWNRSRGKKMDYFWRKRCLACIQSMTPPQYQAPDVIFTVSGELKWFEIFVFLWNCRSKKGQRWNYRTFSGFLRDLHKIKTNECLPSDIISDSKKILSSFMPHILEYKLKYKN